MDLSLDEIILSKKSASLAGKKFVPRNTSIASPIIRKTTFKKSQPVMDARLKIIQNNRARIRDARDKLSEISRTSGDARQRLLMKYRFTHIPRQPRIQSFRNGRPIREPPTTRVGGVLQRNGTRYRTSIRMPPATHLPDILDIPRGYVDYDNMERMEQEEYAAASRLSRTIKNDMTYDVYAPKRADIPSPPRRMNSWGPSADHFDPFDVYEVLTPTRIERHMSPELPPPPPKGILRPSARQLSPRPSVRQLSPLPSVRPLSPRPIVRQMSPDYYEHRYIPESNTHLSHKMRTRLERAPDPHASMGIFAKSRAKSPQLSSSGYRIVVSNLHTSVSQSDIRELFEDIGDIYDARLVRPGVAEVIYKSLALAEKAVDTYHNRQLDGQPMKCLLVNPRSSNKPTSPAIKTPSVSSRPQSEKANDLAVDIDTLHKVLFRR